MVCSQPDVQDRGNALGRMGGLTHWGKEVIKHRTQMGSLLTYRFEINKGWSALHHTQWLLYKVRDGGGRG